MTPISDPARLSKPPQAARRSAARLGLRVLVVWSALLASVSGCSDASPGGVGRSATADADGPSFVRKVPWIDRGVWLKADLHLHTRFSDGGHALEEVVRRGLANGCDVLAVTDHGDSNLTAASHEYFAALDSARRSHPQAILLAGLEWNVPAWKGREHATLLAPAGGDEAKLLSEFKARFDDWQRDPEPSDVPREIAAIRWLMRSAVVERTEPAIVLYNHPSRKREASFPFADEMTKLRKAGPIVIGFEGAPGHQRAVATGAYDGKLKTIDRWDPAAATIGDAWDELLLRGEDVWGATANSDFHDSDGPRALDYAPGEFSATWLYAPDRSAAGALAALRAGTYFAVHGAIAAEVRLQLSAARLDRPATSGESIRVATGEPLIATLELTIPTNDWQNAPNRIDEVELIIVSRSGTKSLVRKAPAISGPALTFPFSAPSGSSAIRARGRRKSPHGPDLMFYTNPIRIVVPGDESSRNDEIEKSLRRDAEAGPQQ